MTGVQTCALPIWYRLEGWDPRTGQRIAAQITGENTNDERRTFYAFPTWQDAAAALLG